jgi:hypothetical protein
MLWPAVEKNKRRPRFSGSCDVHAQPGRLDDLVINSGNSRKLLHHSGSLRLLLRSSVSGEVRQVHRLAGR